MSELVIAERSDIVAIANAVRNKTETTNEMTLGEIATGINSIEVGGEQATPKISIDSNGLITAIAGDKSSTHQLPTQPEQIIIPTTADQVISSGKYLTGVQTIKGDPNLISSNIPSGISIFGVAGTILNAEEVEH